MDRDFHLTNFDNRQLGQINIVITYLEKNNIDVDERLFNSEKSKTKTEDDDKKRVASILNEVKNSILDIYLHHEPFFKLTEKYKPQRSDKVFSKYPKHSKSVREIEDYHS